MKYNYFTAVLILSVFSASFITNVNSATISEVNLELTGNIIDTSCIISGSSEKTVELGKWATKQLLAAGSVTSPVAFSVQLTGCPSGSAAMMFYGIPDNSNSELLALSQTSSAQNIAIEIRDSNGSRLPLQQQNQEVQINENGDATLSFYANYIATGGNITAGSANADITFSIIYN